MAEVFSVEGLLDMEPVVEDPEALMLYESQLMSCIVEDHHFNHSSESSLSVPVWSEADSPPPPQAARLPEKPAAQMASGGGGGGNPNSSSLAESLSANCGQPRVITFGFENYYEDPDEKYGSSGGLVGARSTVSNNNKRSASYAQEHVQVERRRREKLAQRFLQLTALVPGLNTKMDKASIIEEATKYIKQLQERVKLLEQHTSKEKTEEITTLSNQNTQTADDHGSSSSTEDNKISSSSSSSKLSSVNEQLEIYVKVSEDRDHNMLMIRIHSKLDFNLISKIISEVEKLNLKLLSCNVMPFEKHAMDTTLAAKMEDAFCMTLEQLVKHLQVYLQQLYHL